VIEMSTKTGTITHPARTNHEGMLNCLGREEFSGMIMMV
jgi:hypothetical protein